MPAARGVKRTASKTSAVTASSSAPKNKKKRGVIQLEIPKAPVKTGRVLTCGQGDVGQLGLGEDVPEATRFKYVSALGDNIVAVCAGGMHTVALDADGTVWTFGCNDEGALGRATAGDAEEGAPGRVALPAAAVRVSAGDSHTAALLRDGAVYAWGSFRDSHGGMGLVMAGRTGAPRREPTAVVTGEPAADIASGSDHLAVLTVSGAVYTLGCGEQGQLGRLSQRSAGRDARQGFSALLNPSKVSLKQGASRVWCGHHCTFALDAAGERLYAWGLNNYSQLGITGEKRKCAIYSPTECDALPPPPPPAAWACLAAGQHHTLAADSAGAVAALGRCEYGRLGLGPRQTDAETAEAIPALRGRRVTHVAAGTSCSYAATDQGELYAWGMGSEGQLGDGGSADRDTPTLIQGAALRDLHAVQIGGGGQHAVVLVIDPKKQSAKKTEAQKAEQKSEQKPEQKSEPQKPAEEEKKKRPVKKQKKIEDEEEVSSTSTADVGKTENVNGEDVKESTPMEVDETDKAQTTDKPDDTAATDAEPTTESEKPKSDDTKQPEPEPVQDKGTPADKTETESKDVEMKEEVNGTQEAEKTEVETKKPEVDTDKAEVEAKMATDTKMAEVSDSAIVSA